MKTFDIKSDMPTTALAGVRLANIIRTCNGKDKAIKIIHGYGSTGIGGSIKKTVHSSLRNRVRSGEIKAYIPGEAFSQTMGFDESIQTYSSLIKSDFDYNKMNDGITYIILK
ncbi:MAG: hypothetical protein KKG64_05395 [Firmicutes bacterium]|nr:hypothetical protein [Bacillota bacterium]